MTEQISIDESAGFLDAGNELGQVAGGVSYKRLGIANVVFAELVHAAEWVLIDAGVMGTKGIIQRAAEERFGKGAKPVAIVLTHGHFDHVGALKELADDWNVPIYAHPLERPYLDGTESYPPPDPSVGGGLMSTMSRFYPRGPIDVREWLVDLPPEGAIPVMPDWTWIHTPGHTVGHISLWRESDRTLIAGDAFITTAQESAYAVLTQEPELHGPPMYYTTDWNDAGASVARLASLEPDTVITGHGPPLQGPEMRAALHELADRFEIVAVPEQGRYVNRPNQPR